MEQRVAMGVEEVGTILRKIWPYLLVGIGLGAIIHGWVPTDFFTTYANANNPFGVLVAVAIGIPLYSNAAGIMPLVEVLYSKGMPMGTVLAFMMAVVALSLPEMILLRRVLKPKLLALFVGVVATGSSSSGTCSTPSWAPECRHDHDHQDPGPGLPQLRDLDRVTREAVADLGLDATVEKVEDYQAIMDYSVMTTPALVIDDRSSSPDASPTPTALRKILTDAATT